MTGFQPPVGPSPYEQMMAQRKQQGARTVGRPVLSDYQREQRKVATNIARKRATRVLLARHAEELKALATAERHALYALIDKEYAENPDTPRNVYDIPGGGL